MNVSSESFPNEGKPVSLQDEDPDCCLAPKQKKKTFKEQEGNCPKQTDASKALWQQKKAITEGGGHQEGNRLMCLHDEDEPGEGLIFKK